MAAMTLVLGSAVAFHSANAEVAPNVEKSIKWEAKGPTQHQDWFNKQISDGRPLKPDKEAQKYHFVHKNGKRITPAEIAPLIDGTIDFNGNDPVAIGYYTVDGQIQVEYFFANIEKPSMNDIEKYADEVATQLYVDTEAFSKKKPVKGGQ